METSEEYQKELNKELSDLQVLQDEAKQAYTEFGALCDNEGYYQHSGECWNDAFQQVMNNADGIKEIVQKGLIYTPLTQSFDIPDFIFGISSRFERRSKKEQELMLQGKEWLVLYWKESQKRFIRHYLTEVKRRKFLRDECTIDVGAYTAREKLRAISKDLRARRKGEEGKRAAIFGKIFLSSRSLMKSDPHARPSPETYSKGVFDVGGGSMDDISILLGLYSTILFNNTLGYIILNFKKQKKDFLEQLQYVVDDSYGATITISNPKIKTGHMVSIYSCGGNELLFDNNFGIMQFNWRMFFSEYIKRMQTGQSPSIQFIQVLMEEYESGFHLHTNTYPVLSYVDGDKKIVMMPICSNLININTNNEDEFVYSYNKNGVVIKAEYQREEFHSIDEIFSIHTEEKPNIQIENIGTEFQPNARILNYELAYASSFLNDDELIEFIRKTPLDPKMRNISKEGKVRIPVAMMIQAERPTVAIELIKKGFDIETPHEGRVPPLYWAIGKNYPDVVDALLKAGAKISYISASTGNQPIHYTMNEKEKLDILKLLVGAGANINAQNHLGQTPLWLAAKNNFVESVRYLCQAGADPKLSGSVSKGEPSLTPILVTTSTKVRSILTECTRLKVLPKPKSKGGYNHTKKVKPSFHRKTLRHFVQPKRVYDKRG